MRFTFERRLRQPRWLSVAVPVARSCSPSSSRRLVLLATGHNPLSTYRQLFDAAFLQTGSLDQTLIVATPLAFTGLAAAAAFRMKLFNIGAEGQMYIGAITGAAAGLYLGGRGGSSVFVIAAMVVMGCLGGTAWALIPGILRAFFKTNEILTSLLLNYVAGLLLTYLIFQSQSYWRETKGFNATCLPDRQGAAALGRLAELDARASRAASRSRSAPCSPSSSRSSSGCSTSGPASGSRRQVLGDSDRAARYSGVRVRRKILAVMALSGAIAGLGGASQVGDFAHSVDGDPNGLQKLGYGYTGIVIAALARYNPFAVVLVAFLMGGLENAGNTLQGADFPAGLVGVIQGIILFSALGGEVLIRHRVRIVRTKRGAATSELEPAA